jgi:effector-binding domain-containing protein
MPEPKKGVPMTDQAILYKKLEPVLIAAIKSRVESRAQMQPLFERLRAACGEAIVGDALAIFHSGAVKDGFIVEVAFPVAQAVESGEVHTRQLEGAAVLRLIHTGPHQTIRETSAKVYEYLGQHAWSTSLLRREIYRVLDAANPERNVTEVQVVLHEWDRLLAEGAQKVLGSAGRQTLMQGIETIAPESSFEDYTAWIQGAMDRLDALTDDSEKKCQVVSHCAHVFPQERIEHLRVIYQQGHVR